MRGYVSIRDIARQCGVTPRRAARLLAVYLQVPLKTLGGGVPARFEHKAIAIVRKAK